VLVAVAAAAVLVATSLGGGRAAAPAPARTPPLRGPPLRVLQPRAPGAAGVATAYRYALGCLAMRLEGHDQESATASFNRASPCWRYGVYVTAILRRVAGVWRLVLYARSNVCPPRSLPLAVRAQLVGCTSTRRG
jgi:hypothetical protein